MKNINKIWIFSIYLFLSFGSFSILAIEFDLDQGRQARLNTRLVRASMGGDEEQVREFLRQGADPSFLDAFAIRRASTPEIRLILENALHRNLTLANLEFNAEINNLQLVNMLQTNNTQESPVSPDHIRVLLEQRQVQLNVRLIVEARRGSSVEVLSNLITAGADPRILDGFAARRASTQEARGFLLQIQELRNAREGIAPQIHRWNCQRRSLPFICCKQNKSESRKFSDC